MCEFIYKYSCAVIVQSLSHALLFVTPWTAAHQSSLSSTVSQTCLKYMSIELVLLSNHLILCQLLLLLPSIFPSIRVFSNELALHIRWPKYWNFNFSPSSEYSGLISFRIDWFALLTVQGTFKSLHNPASQFKSISSLALNLLYAPILICIHDYLKNHSFDCIWSFVGQVMSMLFNMLFRLVIAFLPRS